MYKIFLLSISQIFNRVGSRVVQIGQSFSNLAMRSKLVEQGRERHLYQTRFDDYYWLNATGYVDKCIIETGIFEPDSTAVIKTLIKRGDVVLDVGANIGYYSVLLSKLVGTQGKVLCFEPTSHYGTVLKANLEANQVDNAEVFEFGLSNLDGEKDIQIGVSSATLHSVGGQPLLKSETIRLQTLDSLIDELNLKKIDFIKIDVDGHEPFFFEGATRTLNRFDPFILFEVNHLNYIEAGVPAWDFYDFLKSQGYYLYWERHLVEIQKKSDFLIKCGNFAFSSNVLATKKKLSEGQAL